VSLECLLKDEAFYVVHEVELQPNSQDGHDLSVLAHLGDPDFESVLVSEDAFELGLIEKQVVATAFDYIQHKIPAVDTSKTNSI